MANPAPNSCNSWLLAGAACLVYCLLCTVYRMSSLFYAALIEQQGMDRESASVPFVVMGFLRCISGLIFGVLGERYGMQQITFLGCYASVLGVGASYIAKSVITLSITLGVLYGFGLTATALLSNIIRDYFDDSATTVSNGFINIGPCITALAFPALIIYIIDEYNVYGAFLLSAGIILNTVPLTMLLKPRNKYSRFRKKSSKNEKFDKYCIQDQNTEDFNGMNVENRSLESAKNIPDSNIAVKNENLNKQVEDRTRIVKITSSFIKKQMPICSTHTQAGCPCIHVSSPENKHSIQGISIQTTTEKISGETAKSPEINQNYSQKSEDIHRQENANSEWSISRTVEENVKSDSFVLRTVENKSAKSELSTSRTVENNAISELSSSRSVVKRRGFFYTLNVLKDPTFMALTVVQGLLAYTFNVWLTTMIDYSRDKGIDRSYEVYILTLNPISDIAGRLGLTWIIDRGYLSVTSFGTLMYVLMAFSSICMALANDFVTMTLGNVIMTFSTGAFLSVCPGMSYAFIEKDKQAVSIASIGLLYGPLSFTVSPLIGYFRGKLGSYDGLYYLMAGMNFACSSIVLLLPKLANMREKKKTKKFITN